MEKARPARPRATDGGTDVRDGGISTRLAMSAGVTAVLAGAATSRLANQEGGYTALLILVVLATVWTLKRAFNEGGVSKRTAITLFVVVLGVCIWQIVATLRSGDPFARATASLVLEQRDPTGYVPKSGIVSIEYSDFDHGLHLWFLPREGTDNDYRYYPRIQCKAEQGKKNTYHPTSAIQVEPNVGFWGDSILAIGKGEPVAFLAVAMTEEANRRFTQILETGKLPNGKPRYGYCRLNVNGDPITRGIPVRHQDVFMSLSGSKRLDFALARVRG